MIARSAINRALSLILPRALPTSDISITFLLFLPPLPAIIGRGSRLSLSLLPAAFPSPLLGAAAAAAQPPEPRVLLTPITSVFVPRGLGRSLPGWLSALPPGPEHPGFRASLELSPRSWAPGEPRFPFLWRPRMPMLQPEAVPLVLEIKLRGRSCRGGDTECRQRKDLN